MFVKTIDAIQRLKYFFLDIDYTFSHFYVARLHLFSREIRTKQSRIKIWSKKKDEMYTHTQTPNV